MLYQRPSSTKQQKQKPAPPWNGSSSKGQRGGTVCVIALTHALAGRRIKYQASLGLEHRPFICSCAPAFPPLHRLPATMAESYVLGPPALEIFPFGIWARPTPGLIPSNLLALLASSLVDHARRASRTLASWDQPPGTVADWGAGWWQKWWHRHTKGNLERRVQPSVPRAALGYATLVPPSSISRSPLGHRPATSAEATTGPAGPRGRERPRENYITAIKTCVRDLEEAVRGNGNVRLETNPIAGHSLLLLFCPRPHHAKLPSASPRRTLSQAGA